MTSRKAAIVITLDTETIQDAHLCIDAEIVKHSILQTPKMKLKQEVIFMLMMFITIEMPFCTTHLMSS